MKGLALDVHERQKRGATVIQSWWKLRRDWRETVSDWREGWQTFMLEAFDDWKRGARGEWVRPDY